MRPVVFVLLLLAVVLGSISCQKNVSSQNAGTGLSGRWNVVTDSFSAGVAAGNHLAVYNGQPGDYYDFRSDSNVYISEDNTVTIYPYHITSATALTLILSDDYSDSIPVLYQVSHLTEHTVTLTNPWSSSPGGTFGRVVYLQR